MIILGAGSGRCGTASLSVLLNGCGDTAVSHEIIPHLSWEIDESNWQYFLWRIEKFDKSEFSFRGDIFSVYLPYMERLVDEDYEWRGIILKRGKDEVVDSFMGITGNRNNWVKKQRVPNPMYVNSFPNYDEQIVGVDNDRKKRALELYWEEYYERAEVLAEKTDKVEIFPTDTLNSKKGQNQIFDFIGIPKRKRHITENCKYNDRKNHGIPIRSW